MSAIANGRRRSRRLIGLGLLIGTLGLLGFAMWAFHIGFLRGLAIGGGALVIYMVPATIFDWPRITWDHIIGFFSAIVSAIAGFFASLFGW